jgi:hypothetical protein
MKPRHCLAALLAVAVCLSASAAREKPAEPKTTVKVYLAAEHAPEGLKAGSRANLMMVTSSARTKGGKVSYSTKPLAPDVEVVSVKREKKPESPDKAVLVELKATKDQAAKIEKVKTTLVTIAESGGTVRKAPIPLRLELLPPAK